MDNFLSFILIVLIFFVCWDSRRSLNEAKKFYEDSLEIDRNIKENLAKIREIKNV